MEIWMILDLIAVAVVVVLIFSALMDRRAAKSEAAALAQDALDLQKSEKEYAEAREAKRKKQEEDARVWEVVGEGIYDHTEFLPGCGKREPRTILFMNDGRAFTLPQMWFVDDTRGTPLRIWKNLLGHYRAYPIKGQENEHRAELAQPLPIAFSTEGVFDRVVFLQGSERYAPVTVVYLDDGQALPLLHYPDWCYPKGTRIRISVKFEGASFEYEIYEIEEVSDQKTETPD